MALERRFGRALTAHFLDEYRKVLKAASNGNYHHPSDEELAQVMRPYLFDAANMGADAAEKPLLTMGLGFDTALTNEAAVAAAREYSYALVRGINDTTRAGLQKYVSEYIAQPTQIDDLAKKLEKVIYNKKRAATIATTETTRAYATAQEVTWKEVNRQYGATIVSGMQWLTANDEIVCFPAFTQVETEHGPRSIQSIKPGDMVQTRYGLRRVIATHKRQYSGDMVTVKAERYSVTATAKHPFWTLEQGWLDANKVAGHTLQAFGNEYVRGAAVHHVGFWQAQHSPTMRHQVGRFAFVSPFVLMPVGAIGFDGNSQIGQEKVNAVSAHAGLLDVGNTKGVKGKSNGTLQSVFASETMIAGVGTELPIGVSGLTPNGFTASQASDNDGRTVAFLGTVVSSTPLGTGLKQLSTAFAFDKGNGRKAALQAANIELEGLTSVDSKGLSANRADLSHLVSPVGVVADPATKVSFLVKLGTNKGLVALLAKSFRSFWSSHISQSLSNYIVTRQRLSGKATTVYNLQVEEHPEYYANGLLVHNCPICAPLGGLVFDASSNEAIPQDEDVQEANARVKPLGGTFTHPGGAGMAARFAGGEYDRPPAHPNCRCSLQPYVEEIPNA